MPDEATSMPEKLTAALVVNRFNSVAKVFSKSTTILYYRWVEPSFTAINWLLQKVHSFPLTVTVYSLSSNALIFIRWPV
ncbi:MAG: hypothetical protein ACHQIM_05145 [Sphingobacteriales bacterium]